LNSVQPIVSVKFKADNVNVWTKVKLLDDNCFKLLNIPVGGLIGPIQIRVKALNGEIKIFTIVDILGIQLNLFIQTNIQFHNGCKDCSSCSQDTCNGDGCSWSNSKCNYIAAK
jgi:hypothetical protein